MKVAKLVSIKLKEGVPSEVAEHIANAFVEHSKDIQGIEAVHFFGDREQNRYGSLTVWESEEAAASGYQILNERLGTAGHEHLESQEENIYEYYTPVSSE